MSVEAGIAVKQPRSALHRKRRKDAVHCCGCDPSQKGCSVFAERAVGADPARKRQGTLPLRWLWEWTIALLLFRTVFSFAVFRITSCWQGVNYKALTRSISLDRAL